MKKIMFALSTTLILVVALGTTPTAVFADDLLGTVESNAVTGPVEVGGITYIPCAAACGGSSISGMVETIAVTSSIEVEYITDIPDRS